MEDRVSVRSDVLLEHAAIRNVASLGSHALVAKIRRTHNVQQRESGDRLAQQRAAFEKTASKPLSEKTGAAGNENVHVALTQLQIRFDPAEPVGRRGFRPVFTADPALVAERIDQVEQVRIIQLADVRFMPLRHARDLDMADARFGRFMSRLSLTARSPSTIWQ